MGGGGGGAHFMFTPGSPRKSLLTWVGRWVDAGQPGSQKSPSPPLPLSHGLSGASGYCVKRFAVDSDHIIFPLHLRILSNFSRTAEGRAVYGDGMGGLQGQEKVQRKVMPS